MDSCCSSSAASAYRDRSIDRFGSTDTQEGGGIECTEERGGEETVRRVGTGKDDAPSPSRMPCRAVRGGGGGRVEMGASLSRLVDYFSTLCPYTNGSWFGGLSFVLPFRVPAQVLSSHTMPFHSENILDLTRESS